MEIARVQGISIIVHPTFWLVLLAYGVLGMMTQALLIFLLVMGHELAHLLTAKAYGFRVIGLELYPFGGAAHCEDLFEGRKLEESMMAIAGPVFNLTLLFGAQALRWEGIWTGPLSEDFVQFNFWLAVFNLVPVLPLDGGRVVRALFSDVFGFVQTTKALARAGQAFGTILGIIGLTLLGQGAYDGISICFLLAGFFWVSGHKEIASARLTFLRQITRKKEELLHKGLMKSKSITVTAEISLIRVVEELTPDRYALIHLPGGEAFGIERTLTETQVVEGMLKKGIHCPVGEL
ncbi:Zn-dependent protease [Desulfitobacterium dichloroeliminans LMG P-21439]|uniref:Zn-dependent protease n=1 Tax=Desulfitobacterium dichloroeliminans (strain LMG P-21439 / DCA1) TaxID=871963 RepID=L0FBR7_DESDL|nr:M50 family metallopeptidase [Desulfitobacterium dichloroeliminans]AGA70460.1 Zn-dependent protease [Desulfitobacterium dichloroeliminans LMG P-21439]